MAPMTTLTWTQVQSWIAKNPYRTKFITPYVPSKESIEGEYTQTDMDGWVKSAVSPGTPLSCILMAQDTMYNASNQNMRKSFLRDETTDLQEKAVLHLKGRTWPVRRTAEGIAACGLEEGRASAWPVIGWRALCSLRECQLLIINQDKKEISFFPEDVRNWSSTVDTFCVDCDSRFIWTHPSVFSILEQWLAKYETNGWTVDWPIAEGTMEELKQAFQKTNEISSGKLNKDALQKRVGRAQTIELLHTWSTTK